MKNDVADELVDVGAFVICDEDVGALVRAKGPNYKSSPRYQRYRIDHSVYFIALLKFYSKIHSFTLKLLLFKIYSFILKLLLFKIIGEKRVREGWKGGIIHSWVRSKFSC